MHLQILWQKEGMEKEDSNKSRRNRTTFKNSSVRPLNYSTLSPKSMSKLGEKKKKKKWLNIVIKHISYYFHSSSEKLYLLLGHEGIWRKSLFHAAKILISCIPSFLNEEGDSFPIENTGEWRGSRDDAAVVGLCELSGELRRQRQRNIVSLTKEAVMITNDLQARIRHPCTQCTIRHSFLLKKWTYFIQTWNKN